MSITIRLPRREPRNGLRRRLPGHVPLQRVPYRHLIRHPGQIETDRTWPS